MFEASATFMNFIGYQTNLVECGPGSTGSADYVRFGLPLQVLVAVGPAVRIWG